MGGPPPDVINSIASRFTNENSINNSFVNKTKTGKSGSLDPGDALQVNCNWLLFYGYCSYIGIYRHPTILEFCAKTASKLEMLLESVYLH